MLFRAMIIQGNLNVVRVNKKFNLTTFDIRRIHCICYVCKSYSSMVFLAKYNKKQCKTKRGFIKRDVAYSVRLQYCWERYNYKQKIEDINMFTIHLNTILA